jgi:WD40 repeat protein
VRPLILLSVQNLELDMLPPSGSDDGTIKLWDILSGQCIKTLKNVRPYERMNISHARGLGDAQKASLKILGAIDEEEDLS